MEEKYKKFKGGELAKGQIEAIDFLLNHRYCILSLGTGYGKTLCLTTAIKIMLERSNKIRAVIVCPVKALKAFRRELFEKLEYTNKEVGIMATNDTKYDLRSNKILVITDTVISKYIDVIAKWQQHGYGVMLAVDEAHKLQDKESKYYKEMVQVKKYVISCWGCTATPILNTLDSLYNIVNFFCEGFLGKKYEFDNLYEIWHLKDQYVKGGIKRKIKVIDGYKNLDHLQKRLKEIMIVRQKKYNLDFEKISKELTVAEKEIYEKVSSGILSSNDVERNFSRRMHDLQRFLDRAYEADGSLVDLVNEYNKAEYSSKEKALLDTVKEKLDKGYSCIIYADYKDTIKRLHEVLEKNKKELGLGKIFEVTGSIGIKIREKVEEQIGQRDIVLITSAGTESVNLQRCNCIIFYDISFSTKTMIQAIGRVCRRNTKYDKQYVVLIVTNGTIDEYKYRLFHNNLYMVQGATSAGEDLPLNEDYLLKDSEDLQRLKDELLWAYKGKNVKWEQLKERVKDNIIVASPFTVSAITADYKFIVEPITVNSKNCVNTKPLYCDEELYRKYVDGKIPFTVLRSDYVKYLHSDRGIVLINAIKDKAIEGKKICLVGDTDIPNVLKEEIMVKVHSMNNSLSYNPF